MLLKQWCWLPCRIAANGVGGNINCFTLGVHQIENMTSPIKQSKADWQEMKLLTLKTEPNRPVSCLKGLQHDTPEFLRYHTNSDGNLNIMKRTGTAKDSSENIRLKNSRERERRIEDANERYKEQSPPDGDELILEWREGPDRIIERRAGPGEEVSILFTSSACVAAHCSPPQVDVEVQRNVYGPSDKSRVIQVLSKLGARMHRVANALIAALKSVLHEVKKSVQRIGGN
ncbi:hypothetical protein EW146_g8153 [Bondarzewia mesenterica]|uniref:Uncharacterized protein n=1 Tax=Bondarzewia mesenterica TaxID=1095465 RepID=A0A4S4LIL8_9AGAM|nr:hypothetical protein EW146_g8153 [Bondarzewia mesenterica]